MFLQILQNSENDTTATSMSQSGSSLTSVVGSRPEDLARWDSRSADIPEELVELHKRFWGKSMADEERAWRTQKPIPDSDGDKGKFHGDIGQDEGMDVDASMDEDSDINPGCYVLDFGIPEILQTPIWIRV
jgi:hypothetical protein